MAGIIILINRFKLTLMKTPRVCGVQIYKDNIKFSKTRNGKIIVIGKKYHFDMNI